MKFEDGTIVENVPFEDIQVTNASLAKEHMHAARDDDDDDDDLKERKKRPESQGASRLEPQKLKEDEFDQVEEDMVEESEEGEEVVKESDDQWYQSELFENLKKKWTK